MIKKSQESRSLKTEKTTGDPQYPRMGILIYPFASGALYNWAVKPVEIVSSICPSTIVVGGGIPDHVKWPDEVEVRDIGVRLHYVKQHKPLIWSTFLWIIKALFAQIFLAVEVYKMRKEIDAVLCLMGVYYQLPILMAVILRKKVICASMGIASLNAKIGYGKLLGFITSILSKINFSLSNIIIVESLLLAAHPDLKPFKEKVVNGALYLQNQERFASKVPVQQRKQVVGFIGRLTREKGIMEFVEAIPLILKNNPSSEFLIIGTGILDDQVGKLLYGREWSHKVKWVKWVDADRVADYLNELKLIVVPSFTEGLPNLILEAMGCGTPILASNVGAIPDLITEGVTGFVMESNAPEAIQSGVQKALDCSDVEKVVKNAKKVIVSAYTFEAACNRYKTILRSILKNY